MPKPVTSCMVAAFAAVFIAAGCGPMGYKITPIPVSEKLREKVVWKDRGLVFDKVALIELDGMLVNAERSGLLVAAENPVALAVEKLDKAAADPFVKAVILRINSPGGTVTASDLVYRQVLKVRQGFDNHKPKPVVAMLMDVAASGAYYIACGADKIIAHPTTVTGSIGVIMYALNIEALMHKLGVAADAIKSGDKKDAGSLFRPLTPQERKIFQGVIDEFYSRFLEVVKKGRPDLDEKKLSQLADGRVFTGQQARDLHLVDQVGDLFTAINAVKETTGLSKVKVVMYHRPADYRANVYSQLPETCTVQFNLLNVTLPDLADLQRPQFMYLWTAP